MNDIVRKVTNVTQNLIEISKEGYNLEEVANIWAQIPLEDNDGMTYLEAASQCILETSNLVDNSFTSLSQHQRTAKKYRLLAQLLNLKADQLDASI